MRRIVLNPYLSNPDSGFSNVVLLLHGNETSPPTIDSSVYARTPSADGSGRNISEQIYGAACITYSGTTVTRWPDAPEFSLGTQDFTIELSARFSTTGDLRYVFGQSDSTGNNSATSFAISRTAGDAIRLVVCSGSTAIANITGGTVIAANTWYYIAAKRSGSTFSLVVGTTGATVLQGTATSSSSVNDSSGVLALGGLGEFDFNLMSGAVEEVRFTVGVARDISTVPISEFPGV